MNFLARFEAIEKECEQNQILLTTQEKDQKKDDIIVDLNSITNESDTTVNTNEWIEKKNMKPEDKVRLRSTHVKVVPLSTLVWATLVNIRGGSAYVFGRICNKAEAAHYSFYPEELDEFGLIPDGKVIVEYFSLPDNYPQYAIKDPSTLKAYNEPIRKTLEKSPIDQWHPDNCNNLVKTILRRKYSSNVAQYIYDEAFAVANEFLRLAIQQENEDSVAFKSSPGDVVDVSTNPVEAPDKPIDMSVFVLTNSPAKRVSLKAGCWIGYEDKIFKNTKVTQIIEIPVRHKSTENSSTSSIILANGDILFQHDLICKYKDDPTIDPSCDHSGYHPLDEYRLISGKLSNVKSIHHEMAKETKTQLNQLEEETGLILNRKSQKRKELPTTSPSSNKKRGK